MTGFLPLLPALAVHLLGTAAVETPSADTSYARVLPLKPEEGVFAYARITGDGALLSYASEVQVAGQTVRTANVVELEPKRLLFSEPGQDAYWAPDGRRLIFLSTRNGEALEVSMWHRDTGAVTRDVAPSDLGAYFSWATREGQDLVLTQNNRYFFLEAERALRPYRQVRTCEGIGRGEQPMISRDGRVLATFVRGDLVVRGLDECVPILETHLPGGKADFSWDGRYIAFHMPKEDAVGYRIVVVDVVSRRMIPVTDLPGSSYYPSWTRDGRLCFRYDGPDYRGFVIASGFLGRPSQPLPQGHLRAASATSLTGLFGDRAPKAHVVLVNFWASWCVHCRGELPRLDKLRRDVRARGLDVEIVGACEPGSPPGDRAAIIAREHLTLPQLDISPSAISEVGVQMFPTSLLFVDGSLKDRWAGSQSDAQILEWLAGDAPGQRDP